MKTMSGTRRPDMKIRERRWPAHILSFRSHRSQIECTRPAGRAEDYLALCEKEQRHLRYALKLCDLDRSRRL